ILPEADADGASQRVRMTQATERGCSQPSLTLPTARTSRRLTTSICRCSARTSARRRPSKPRNRSATSLVHAKCVRSHGTS
ncbi:hypothetical protein PFISCL1PPCAC_27004, partial [Pristionchus fissidentatus]